MRREARIPGELRIRRGDLFLVDLGVKGEEIWRPVLVVQNDIGNRLCATVIVVPLLPVKRARRLFFGIPVKACPEYGLDVDHLALFSQLRTLPRNLFTSARYLGRLNRTTLVEADRALELSLGLSTLQRLMDRSRARKKGN